MPSRKKTPVATPAPDASPATATPPARTRTGAFLPARKASDRSPMTHEVIAADLEAFRKSGGKIEVLGVTRTLQRIGADANADEAPSAPARPGVTRKTR
ncbi:hypothetical protein DCD74_03460 [Lysobacter oculi]|uniref:Uncharacterized protein n=1 Tax=Solilutibacter oculi TaxID=2698682 RepID=A0A344J4B0_9GAMM|nr:hypothetical protein [Lysobacter oculi]AXA83870.1 hypothetical protein DCD74_03460 [Lysobacter oculi]